MNLGLTGRTAFVAASSQGLGLACAVALAREGVEVTLNGRDEVKLAEAATQLAAISPVPWVVADLTAADGRSAIVEALPEVDILVTNNAGPAPGALEDWDEDALVGALRANMVPAVELMRSYIPGMQKRRFGRVVNVTSAMVTSPAYEMGLSTSARASLTAISKSISRSVARDNVTVNNLLPERIDTPRQEFMATRLMDADGIGREEARRRISSTIPAGRFGRPEEFGDACAYLCSAQAGYISGQNLHLDGGSYRGLV
ncbi:SDR family oxidoreductase [Paramicrobacterium chengjingii]|uniref:SDR family oxidoreductase n=1 Tax=Paramicrobacterium chengjingii TaxID=2769067 RepID=UPI001422E631|nr:SDR family oxidoreductase [Microbacterium chengjingii]